jgi:trehalose 6-phosphate phosphatase
MTPPPTPKSALKNPAASPINTRRTGSYPRLVTASILAQLSEAPDRAAILLDIDGTLAPIVPRPEQASVPRETRAELARLARRYGLVACVSGRSGADAERVVAVDGLTYVGLHGLELDPRAERYRDTIRSFAETVDWPVEDKGLTVSFHYRSVEDERAALAELEVVAERARTAGLRPHFGRKVLEVLPPVDADKGTAVRHLLEGGGLRRALYAGDDRTDVDAFRALEGLDLGVRVAVASAEGPRELREAADVVVDGPAELLRVLRSL